MELQRHFGRSCSFVQKEHGYSPMLHAPNCYVPASCCVKHLPAHPAFTYLFLVSCSRYVPLNYGSLFFFFLAAFSTFSVFNATHILTSTENSLLMANRKPDELQTHPQTVEPATSRREGIGLPIPILFDPITGSYHPTGKHNRPQ